MTFRADPQNRNPNEVGRVCAFTSCSGDADPALIYVKTTVSDKRGKVNNCNGTPLGDPEDDL